VFKGLSLAPRASYYTVKASRYIMSAIPAFLAINSNFRSHTWREPENSEFGRSASSALKACRGALALSLVAYARSWQRSSS